MKLLVFFSLLFVPFNFLAQTSVMSFNIRYNNPADGENWWEYRKSELVAMLDFYSPDILGIQEGLFDQVQYLDSALTAYKYVGVGRDNGQQKGEYAAIFYNAEDLEMISTSTYWLSETPDTVSVGWDASMERIVTFGVFKKIIGEQTYHVFNCHFDHMGQEARTRSAELILKMIEEKGFEAEKVIVLGDFNAEPTDDPIQILNSTLDDAFAASKLNPYGPVGTFNAFEPCVETNKRIDYIFCKNIIVQKYRSIDDRRSNNLCISDHLPVLVELE